MTLFWLLPALQVVFVPLVAAARRREAALWFLVTVLWICAFGWLFFYAALGEMVARDGKVGPWGVAFWLFTLLPLITALVSPSRPASPAPRTARRRRRPV